MISVIVPFHDEKESLPLLIPELSKALKLMGRPYEIILVDDGSLDAYIDDVKPLLDANSIKLVKMGRQMGKGKALQEGVTHAKGDIIVFMDADLQDDPQDLSIFYAVLSKGYDLVNGHRHTRRDGAAVRLYSRVASWFLKRYLKSPFSDINCGFKMFRSEILDKLPLYGNNFRFFPLAAFYEGYLVSEVKVNNKPRLYGKTKYGTKKLFIGMIDMISAYFLYKFADRPLHFFGSIGTIFLAIGSLWLVVLTFERIFMGMLLYRRPALQYAILIIIVGIQIFLTGIIGELVVYLHKKDKNR